MTKDINMLAGCTMSIRPLSVAVASLLSCVCEGEVRTFVTSTSILMSKLPLRHGR